LAHAESRWRARALGEDSQERQWPAIGALCPNRYAIRWRLETAKLPATRARRLEQLVAMLARGEKIHEHGKDK